MQKQPFNWFYGLDRFNDPNLNDNTRNPLLSHYVGLFLTSLFFNCCYLLAFGHAKIDEVQLKTIPGSNAHHFFYGLYKRWRVFPLW